MKFRADRKEPVGVNLTPLIDVVFLLLIFFMVSTSFTREAHIQIDLPEASAEPSDNNFEAMTLSVNSAGAYAINGRVLSSSNKEVLEDGLKVEADGDYGQSLIIVADAQATHQSVVTAMDVAGRLGFVNLRISTQEYAED